MYTQSRKHWRGFVLGWDQVDLVKSKKLICVRSPKGVTQNTVTKRLSNERL